MDYTFLKEKMARDLRASRIRLIAMVVILIIVGGFVVKYAPGGRPAAREELVSPKVTTLGSSTITGFTPVTPPPPIEPKEGIPPAKVLEQIQDRHSDLEPAPFFYMLHHVSQDKLEDLKAQAKKGLDWNLLWDKPETLRDQPVEVRGTLIRSVRQALGENPLKLNEVWLYRIQTEDRPRESQGYIYDVYSIEKLQGALPFDQMVAYGRFLKARTLEPDHYIDPELHAAVVVVPRIEPLTYLDAPQPPQPIVPDGRPEARAIYYFLKRADAIPFAELKAKALRGLNLVSFTGNPDRYLGKPVAVRGELLRCQRIALSENPLRIESVYYGQIVDIDHTINTFYCLHIPDGLRIKDEVVLYGFFLKKWSYTNQSDSETTSPVFIGKTLVQVVFQKDHTLDAILGAMIGIIALLLLIAHFRTRRQVIAEAEARRQRDLARVPQNLNEVARRILAEAHGEAPPPKPQPPPSEPPKPEAKP